MEITEGQFRWLDEINEETTALERSEPDAPTVFEWDGRPHAYGGRMSRLIRQWQYRGVLCELWFHEWVISDWRHVLPPYHTGYAWIPDDGRMLESGDLRDMIEAHGGVTWYERRGPFGIIGWDGGHYHSAPNAEREHWSIDMTEGMVDSALALLGLPQITEGRDRG